MRTRYMLVLAAMLLAPMLQPLAGTLVSASSTGTWVEGEPLEVQVSAVPVDERANITVKLLFRDTGYSASWSNPLVQGDTIIIDVAVLRWTGPSAQVITGDTRSFTLKLEPGKYNVILKVNGEERASETLLVPVVDTGTRESGEASTLLVIVLAILASAAVLFLALRR